MVIPWDGRKGRKRRRGIVIASDEGNGEWHAARGAQLPVN